MTFAACVGSYSLPHFISLQILSLRHVFGDIPILISDDKSSESPVIESVAAKHEVAYCCSEARRGHFAGDVQCTINALQFARQCNADIAVKISQRMVLVSPTIKPIAEGYLSRDNIALALPGTPSKIQICGTSKGFARMPHLTDVLFFRMDRMMSAEAVRDFYEASWKLSGDPRDGIPEIAMTHMIEKPLLGKVCKFTELTYHDPNRPKDKLFHRRYQSTSSEIRRFAQSLGCDGFFQVGEWRTLDANYRPRPQA